ncbi:MAG TPA: RraA family protein [Terriglobia bacterium]|nr:RraA family protein [Terriglobia bacterium]
MSQPDKAYRQRLLKLDTCIVSDALDKLGLTGVATGIQRLATDTKIVGPVVTVRLEAANGRTAERHLCTAAIEAARPGEIIVVEHHSRSDCAGWGGILSRAAGMQKIAGVIVDGICRDIDESRELGFPVFGRGVSPVTARGRIIETAFNIPVTIGSAPVKPGDWVIADGSGVVFISAANLDLVLEQAEVLLAREAQLVAEIEAGTPVSQVMSRTYEHMTRKETKRE